MATPRKTAQGTWRIQIEVRGVRDGITLPTKREATEWAQRRAIELRTVSTQRPGSDKKLLHALRRYADEVSPTKRGNSKEQIRLMAFEKHPLLPVSKVVREITTADMALWRDARLSLNARGTVLRDISLLSSVFEACRRDWGWIESNPLKDMRKPSNPDHRMRVISGVEIRGVLRALGYTRGGVVRSVGQAVAGCFLLALATGMRAGELCGLEWGRVYPTHVHLPITKNGRPRDVPLSPVAVRIIERMRGWDGVSVFGIKSQTLDAMFRRARGKAGLDGFCFHDARHSAATRLAKQLHVLELCKMFGWSDPKMAMIYFNPSAASLALKLA